MGLRFDPVHYLVAQIHALNSLHEKFGDAKDVFGVFKIAINLSSIEMAGSIIFLLMIAAIPFEIVHYVRKFMRKRAKSAQPQQQNASA